MENSRKCWKCHTDYPPEMRICVRCGINLETGQSLNTVAPAEDAAESETQRAGNFITDTFPGLFRPGVLIAAIIATLIACTLLVMCVVLIVPATSAAFATGALGLVIYAHAVTWILTAEMNILHLAMVDFRGKDWTSFVVLVFGPLILLLSLARQAMLMEARENEALSTPPVPEKVDPKVAEAAVDKNYVISSVGQSAAGESEAAVFFGRRPGELGARSGIATDGKGNLYFTESFALRRVHVASGIESLIAGSGQEATRGLKGGPALKATMNMTGDVAVDSNGNIYFVDTYHVRKLDSEGMVTVYAGAGSPGSDGDGGPAKNAKLNYPMRLAVDPKGNLHISEPHSHCVRKVDAATGIIDVVAGTGESGFSGDGGSALEAQLSSPQGIAFDAQGNLYICDLGNTRIRKVTEATGKIKTIAGNGSTKNLRDGGPALESYAGRPTAIAVDDRGNVFFLASGYPNRIRKIDAATGIVCTVAGDGTAKISGDGGPSHLATLDGASSLAADKSGTIYIGDGNNYRIRKLDRQK